MKLVWLASPFIPLASIVVENASDWLFASIVVENASDWLSHQIKQVDKK